MKKMFMFLMICLVAVLGLASLTSCDSNLFVEKDWTKYTLEENFKKPRYVERFDFDELYYGCDRKAFEEGSGTHKFQMIFWSEHKVKVVAVEMYDYQTDTSEIIEVTKLKKDISCLKQPLNYGPNGAPIDDGKFFESELYEIKKKYEISRNSYSVDKVYFINEKGENKYIKLSYDNTGKFLDEVLERICN